VKLRRKQRLTIYVEERKEGRGYLNFTKISTVGTAKKTRDVLVSKIRVQLVI